MSIKELSNTCLILERIKHGHTCSHRGEHRERERERERASKQVFQGPMDCLASKDERKN